MGRAFEPSGAKRRLIAPPLEFSYPDITKNDQQSEDNGNDDSIHPWSRRLIPVTTSTEWGSETTAAFRAQQVGEVTPANEQLIRTYHPALRACRHVETIDSKFGPSVWAVPYSSSAFGIEAGGRPIHVQPAIPEHLFSGQIMPLASAIQVDHLFRGYINPRKFPTPTHLDNIRTLFPSAIGVRILVIGYMVVLFANKRDVVSAYESTWPLDIGGLHVAFDVALIEPTTEPIITGFEVSRAPENETPASCLGLKLRMKDGRDVITVPTHGFVKIPHPPNPYQKMASWVLAAKKSLQCFRPPRQSSESPAVGTSRGPSGNLSHGATVWLVGGDRKIGTITQTYDSPSSSLPYPQGYHHDLSLITDPSLPDLASPPGYPRITGWSTYSAALDGSPVYAIRLNTITEKSRVMEGSLDSSAIKNATICGTQYMWNKSTFTQNACVLWRSADSLSPADGWSGSVLCLGRPSDSTSQAIAFQNFQIPLNTNSNDPTKEPRLLKGGFVLPLEIREATIILSDNNAIGNVVPERRVGSMPMRRPDASSERRSFSGP